MLNSLTRPLASTGDALGHQKDEVADLVKIYALIGRIRLVSSRAVVTAAERTMDTISQTYLEPNRTLRETSTGAGPIFLLNSGRPADRTWVWTEQWGSIRG